MKHCFTIPILICFFFWFILFYNLLILIRSNLFIVYRKVHSFYFILILMNAFTFITSGFNFIIHIIVRQLIFRTYEPLPVTERKFHIPFVRVLSVLFLLVTSSQISWFLPWFILLWLHSLLGSTSLDWVFMWLGKWCHTLGHGDYFLMGYLQWGFHGLGF